MLYETGGYVKLDALCNGAINESKNMQIVYE